MRIAVLSDIHSNALALAAALARIEREGCDLLVVLGDLLTYGPDPVEVLSLIERQIQTRKTALLTGNHDWAYMQMFRGKSDYVIGLPDWIQESFAWTFDQISRYSQFFLQSDLWLESFAQSAVLFAHANPFGMGNWKYLNDSDTVAQALRAIRFRAFRLGVFGHNHRRCLARYSETSVAYLVPSGHHRLRLESECETYYVNPGSVGQPRDETRVSTFVFLDMGSDTASVRFIDIQYDLADHLKRIAAISGISDTAKQKLLGYYPQFQSQS